MSQHGRESSSKPLSKWVPLQHQGLRATLLAPGACWAMPGKAVTHWGISDPPQPRPPCDGNLQPHAWLEPSHPIRLCQLRSPLPARHPPTTAALQWEARMADGGAQSFQGYSPCLAPSIILMRPRERGPRAKGRQERAAPSRRARKATLGTASAEQGPFRSCGGATDCNSFCLRWAKCSRCTSRKRLFWSELQNIVFAQLNSPACAFSLKSRQLSGRFPSSLLLLEQQCSSLQPISELGSGVKGLPKFTALIAEPLPSGASIKQCAQGSPPWSSLGYPGDNQPHPPTPQGLQISPIITKHRVSPSSPGSLLHSSLDLTASSCRPGPHASLCRAVTTSPHCWQVCQAGGGAHVSPAPSWHSHAGLGSPTPCQPHPASCPLFLHKPHCSGPVATIKYSWPCMVNKHYEFMTC